MDKVNKKEIKVDRGKIANILVTARLGWLHATLALSAEEGTLWADSNLYA